MTLAAGARLGPYEIVSPLGAGGMGEVYRARDTRLGREVAVKVLPPSFSQDANRLRRFEQEARAVSALNHPNVVSLYDVGQHDGAPYVVIELLEGETLRERFASGALSPRKAIDYAIQIAQGLAAAHGKGIIHRDLKPENIFVTQDGRLKILDFGLAKLTHQDEPDSSSGAMTMTTLTRPDSVVGTVGYMSPEQVRGQKVDARSDIFTFGAVLYEALAGRRAFWGATVADTMSAILHEEPPDLAAANPSVSPGVERVVRHCLEKDCERRFQSAGDLAFDLEGLAIASVSGRAGSDSGQLSGSVKSPVYRRLTFRRGTIPTARFSPDEQTVLCCARWEGDPLETFALRLDSPESRPLALPEARLLAVSTSGELAVTLGVQRTVGGPAGGLLATLPFAGGAPRERLEGVKWADWSPDGSSLAVVRAVDGRDRLEFPIGVPIHEQTGWIAFIRVSPKGDLVAFMDYPTGGTTGSVAVVDRKGRVRRLSGVWSNARGLAWSPDGEEIWFTATNFGFARALHAVNLERRERLIEAVPGGLYLHDVSRSGRVLLTHDQTRSGILCRVDGQPAERELSWFDYSAGPELSFDGREILFSEGGEGGGRQLSTYLRRTDGAPAVRLGDGEALALSPDGKWAVSRPVSLDRLLLIPTRAGQTRELLHEGFVYRSEATWFPDGTRLLFAATVTGQSPRSYVHDLSSGETHPATPEGVIAFVVSPDGRYIVGGDSLPQQFPVAGGDPRPIAGALRGDIPIRWHGDGRSIFVRSGFIPAKVSRIDLMTGAREPHLELIPSDPAGVAAIDCISLTPDARSYAYSYMWMRSDLYAVEGLA